MKKQLPDFKQTNNTGDDFYDLREDWALIESSIAKQYGIRLRQEPDMPWAEFCTLVSGLMPDTPLGQIVSIRAEKDPTVIKGFTPDQKRIQAQWRKLQAANRLKAPEQLEKDMNALADMFKNMFGKR